MQSYANTNYMHTTNNNPIMNNAMNNGMNNCSGCNACNQQPTYNHCNIPQNPTNYNYNVYPSHSPMHSQCTNNTIEYSMNGNSSSGSSSSFDSNCNYIAPYKSPQSQPMPSRNNYQPSNTNTTLPPFPLITQIPNTCNYSTIQVPPPPQRTPSVAPIFPSQPSISAIPIISDIPPLPTKKRRIAHILHVDAGQNKEVCFCILFIYNLYLFCTLFYRIPYRQRLCHSKNKSYHQRSDRCQALKCRLLYNN